MQYKVLVISSYKSTGNSAIAEAELLLGLKRQGLDVDVMMAGEAHYSKVFRDAGMKVFDHHLEQKISLRSIRFIRKVVKENGYDLLHLYNNKAAANGVLASLGLPVKLITYRGFTGNVLWYKPTSLLNHLNPKVNRITCVSDAVREQVRSQLWFNKNKAVTVYKGHDMDWYNNVEPVSRESIGVPDDAFMVGIVANARPMKGVKYFIQAANYLKGQEDIHFVMIGKNMDHPEYLKLIRQSPYPGNFHILGFRSDSLNVMAAADVGVLSSVKGEGLSKTTIEAMSLQKPVIATRIGGNPELVRNNDTGLLIPPKNPKAIAEGIARLKNDRNLALQLGKRARKHVETNFTIRETIRQTRALYDEVMQNK